ncbi:cysteine hydrolase [Mycobacterium hackensackense]|uniref:cysteine hydrolase family protein n=1 Tax=Mycobacterium hackensackense TaxID=228909 RepID=UPI002265CF7A|nr:isochorismatase family cysteine hydrolase [Mycobacterium hackensackense]MCV7254715.1 cysteine hydrolase [Mycobacterium hackensackense]
MSRTALLVIDMLNDYRHPDGEDLARSVAGMVDPLVALAREADKREDVDVIYVNDNRGDFTADHNAIVRAALDGAHPELVRPVIPAEGELILTKVRHSVFYSTALDYLLGRLGTQRLILTGQVTEQCILYSALDGYIRHFDVVVPPDAVACIDTRLGAAALQMMQRNMDADLAPSDRCLP